MLQAVYKRQSLLSSAFILVEEDRSKRTGKLDEDTCYDAAQSKGNGQNNSAEVGMLVYTK